MYSQTFSLAILASTFLSVSAAPFADVPASSIKAREDQGSPGSPYECAANFNAAARKATLNGEGATPQGMQFHAAKS